MGTMQERILPVGTYLGVYESRLPITSRKNT